MHKSSLNYLSHTWSTKKKELDITKIIEDYNSGLGCVFLEKKYNVSYRVILDRLKKVGIRLRSASESARRYVLNHGYFKKINNKKAYILGLLFADGYNQENKNSITLQLSSPDEYILSKIGNEIYKNKDFKLKIRNFNNFKTQYSLRIYSKQLSEDLANLGCVQRKSLVLKFPKIEEKYHSHFIRGYFDGDGCISIGKRNRQITFLGTLEFLEKLQEILSKNCNINKPKPFKKNNIYSIAYSGKNQCLKIAKFIYKYASNWKLQRKFEKFKLLN